MYQDCRVQSDIIDTCAIQPLHEIQIHFSTVSIQSSQSSRLAIFRHDQPSWIMLWSCHFEPYGPVIFGKTLTYRGVP